ncbi:MAG: hypothetical protein IT497_08095 [Ottowia sp.]|nr:hypothetical protein [Ottowia sp.]
MNVLWSHKNYSLQNTDCRLIAPKHLSEFFEQRISLVGLNIGNEVGIIDLLNHKLFSSKARRNS